MGMPISDIVQSSLESFHDLTLLGPSVRNVRGTSSMIRSARPCGFLDNDAQLLEASEQLAARFFLPCAPLSISTEALYHPVAENQDLSGCTDRVLDHATALLHSAQSAAAGHWRSSTKPPCSRPRAKALQVELQTPPAA